MGRDPLLLDDDEEEDRKMTSGRFNDCDKRGGYVFSMLPQERGRDRGWSACRGPTQSFSLMQLLMPRPLTATTPMRDTRLVSNLGYGVALLRWTC